MIILQIEIGTGLEQAGDDLFVAVAGSEHERRTAVGRQRIGAGALGQQQIDDGAAPLEGSVKHGVPAPVLEGCAGLEQLFGDTGTNIIGTRHGEKLFETLMTREERLRSQDMGHYFRVAADNRDLNYDKFVVKGEVHTMADESYTSHNTTRLDVEGTVKKILTTEYVQNALKGIPNV